MGIKTVFERVVFKIDILENYVVDISFISVFSLSKITFIHVLYIQQH